jgi:hypothetical protein
MNRSVHPPGVIVVDCVTSFVRSMGNAQLLSAELKHLRHERQRVQLASVVKSGQDLSSTPDLHQFPRAKIQPLL